MMAAAPYQTPTFSIFKAPGSSDKVDTLQHCFFKRMTIDTTNPPANIRGDDGWVYTAVYDARLPATTIVEAIVSFQSHTYGRFAVIRLAKDQQQGH